MQNRMFPAVESVRAVAIARHDLRVTSNNAVIAVNEDIGCLKRDRSNHHQADGRVWLC